MRRRRYTGPDRQLTLWAGGAPTPPSRGDVVPVSWKGMRVHLIGIGGIGMSGIASLLQQEGCIVSGCDARPSGITDNLVRQGVSISVGHSPEHIADGPDVVVVSAAIRDTNPELRAARSRNITVLKYAQMLGSLMRSHDGIAVSGSHGKTTTTSMIAISLKQAGKNPSVVVGGVVPQLGGNSRCGNGGPFVVEACEYDRSFLNLAPKTAVITNIDRDHLDYYRDLDELVDAFGDFTARVPQNGLVLVNGDDPHALRAAKKRVAPMTTFGEGPQCDWRVGEWNRADGRTRFRAFHKGRNIGVFDLLIPGFHNVRNAMACIAACDFFGANRQHVREALAEFKGAKRRFDRLGEAAGVMVLDDYGHHPTEVKVTLDAARQEFPKRRLWCVFQPHQCSRTRLLMDDFAQSFGSADHVIVPDIFACRDSAADRASVSSRDLVRRLQSNGVEAEYVPQFPQTVNRLLSVVRRGDLVMTMGAGPVDDVAHSLLVELKKREGQDGLA